MSAPWILWGLFVAIIAGLWAIEWRFLSGDSSQSLRNAVWRSLLWLSAGFLFCGAVWIFESPAKATEFMAGYLIEKSLSVDNLFVFIMIFSFFNVEPQHQPRVLRWGIIGAIVLRLVLILLGTYLVSRFHWVFYIFGALLLYSAYKMAFGGDEEFNPDDSRLFRLLRKALPMTGFHGHRFFVAIDKKWHATPLFLTVAVVEFSDLVFALDSIPAIFSITTDPFIVYTSNILAILGLRALFFVVSGLVEMFIYLKQGVAVILAFVGVKMLLADWYHISTGQSLGVVVAILTVSMGLSWIIPKKKAVQEG